MEKSNRIGRSEVWHNIYEVLAKLELKEVEGDSLDRPSAATEIEGAVKKLLPIHNVSDQLVCECCKDNLVEEQGDWCQECLDNPSRVITK